MTDADILEAQPMDINDDDKPCDLIENGSSDSPDPSGKVIQVTNVSPGATLQQLATLFGFLGTVTDIRLYPSDEAVQIQVKVCFIKYENNEQCGVAQHLTNTVFIDKALIVVPIKREEIPEEAECQHLLNSINAYATLATTGYLPSGFPADETAGTIPGLPPPPVITCSTDPVEIEEIKRTIFVKDIDKSVTSEQLMAFFSGVGEVKYMRICNPIENRYAFIEFSAPESVPTALQYNGVIFGGKCLKVEHAKSAIIKPESERIASGRNPSRSSRDVVRRPSSVNYSPKKDLRHFSKEEIKLRKSRSRSISRRRSRSRGRTSKGRSRSKARSRSRSKSRKRRSRTRSPPRRRSPVRSPRRRSRSRSRSRPRRRTRSRTRSPIRRRRRSTSRSRSRSRSKRRTSRSRSRSRDRRRKKRSISKSPSRSPRRRKRSRTKSRSPKRKSKKSTSKSPDRTKKKRGKDDKKEKDKDRSKDKEKDKDKDKGKDKDKEKENDKEKEEKKVSPEKELKNLLDKVYTYEEEKEKEKRKEKEKSSKEKELLKAED